MVMTGPKWIYFVAFFSLRLNPVIKLKHQSLNKMIYGRLPLL